MRKGAVLTIDISGMGGSYELGCQKMLLQGMRFLGGKPDFNFGSYKQYSNIYGICSAENDDAKALDKAVCEGVEPSGAMHQAVIKHLAYIHRNGYKKWLDYAKSNGMTVYELPPEDEIDKELLVSQIEWRMKLDRGYNPLAEILEKVPPEHVISFDPDNPDSIRDAAIKIADLIRKLQQKE